MVTIYPEFVEGLKEPVSEPWCLELLLDCFRQTTKAFPLETDLNEPFTPVFGPELDDRLLLPHRDEETVDSI